MFWFACCCPDMLNTIITEGTIYLNSCPFLIKTQVALNNPGEVDSTIFNANIMKTRRSIHL